MSAAVPTGGTTISNLPNATSLKDGDEVIIDRDGKVYRSSELVDTVNELSADLTGIRGVYSGYTNINDIGDLNNVNSVGMYVCTSSGSAREMENNPTGANAFILRVINSINANSLIQFVVTYNKPRIFARYYYNGSWGEWVEFTST